MTAVLDLFNGATRHKLSVDDYYRMAETGILKRQDRVELIDGEIIDLAPITSEHAGHTNWLAMYFARAAEGVAMLSVQTPLRLDTHNEPQPDLMLLRPRKDVYRRSHPTAADVLLLVEVSDTSLGYDRGAKLTLYAKHKIPEVWIVNIPAKSLEIYRYATETGFSSEEDLKQGMVTPDLLQGLMVNLDELFS